MTWPNARVLLDMRTIRQLCVVKAWALLLLLGATPAHAGEVDIFEYEVVRDGAPIGYNRVSAEVLDGGSGLKMTYDSELEVKFGFITVFSYSHQRQEMWQDGKLLRVSGHIDKDGDRHAVDVESDGTGYARIIDGQREELSAERWPLTFWNLADLKGHTSFFSVADEKLPTISIESHGEDWPTWWSGMTPLEHYSMTGDLERDFWFDSANNLVRVIFDNRGSQIEFRLKEPPLAAQR